jgi:6-phosphogluconolactonase
VRKGDGVKQVPGGLSVFRIGGDGKLAFARKYDADVTRANMFWMGMFIYP